MGFWEELIGLLFSKVHVSTEACGGTEPVLACMGCGPDGKDSQNNDQDADSSSNDTASSDLPYPEEDEFDVRFFPRGNEFQSDLSVISEERTERTLYTQRLHPTDSFVLKQIKKGDQGNKK